jgi:hypothetical protein
MGGIQGHYQGFVTETGAIDAGSRRDAGFSNTAFSREQDHARIFSLCHI